MVAAEGTLGGTGDGERVWDASARGPDPGPLPPVLKYRKADEDSLMEKISKLNFHSIIKKSNRVSSHLKHLTGFAPQVAPIPYLEG